MRTCASTGADEIATTLPKRAWKRLSAGDNDAKGERLYDWALLPWAEEKGWKHTLLVRRSIKPKLEYAFYFTYAPKEKSTFLLTTPVVTFRWAAKTA